MSEKEKKSDTAKAEPVKAEEPESGGIKMPSTAALHEVGASGISAVLNACDMGWGQVVVEDDRAIRLSGDPSRFLVHYNDATMEKVRDATAAVKKAAEALRDEIDAFRRLLRTANNVPVQPNRQ